MIIPVFIGVILFFSSILLNNILFSVFNQGAYYIPYNFWYIVFGILTVVLTNISTLTIYLKFNQIITREAYTLTAFYNRIDCAFNISLGIYIWHVSSRANLPMHYYNTLSLHNCIIFRSTHL